MNLFLFKKNVLKLEGRQIYGNIEMKNLNLFSNLLLILFQYFSLFKVCKIWKFCTKAILYERKETVSIMKTTTTTTAKNVLFEFKNKVDLIEKDPHLFQSKYLEEKLKEVREREREEVKKQKDKSVNEIVFLFRSRDY